MRKILLSFIGAKIQTIQNFFLPSAAAANAVLAEPAAAVDRGRRRGAALHQLVVHHAHRWRHLYIFERGALLLRAGDVGVGELAASGQYFSLTA